MSVIEKIELNIGGKRIALSLEQAKELRDALETLFPRPAQQTIYIPCQPAPYVNPWRGPYWYSSTKDNIAYLSASGGSQAALGN